VASADAPDPVVVAGRAKAAPADLREVMPQVLAESGGKGGGSPDLVQATARDASGVAAAAQRFAVWLSERIGEREI
jgi:alanyl-tRNA synthetase